MVDNFLIDLNQIVTAGIVITAFSLLLYALAFNMRSKIARSYAVLLLCVVIVFASESISSVSRQVEIIDFLLRFQWLGILWLPSAYIHFSKSLLTITGISVRKWIYWIPDIISVFFIGVFLSGNLLGALNATASPAPYLVNTRWTNYFILFYIVIMILCERNILRARQHSKTRTARHRMNYLLLGSLAPAVGSFPYLLYGGGLAEQFPTFFWFVLLALNIMIGVFTVSMSYAVAFFGVTQPDRVIKYRLARWLLRGPITAIITLTITTIVRRAGENFGYTYSAFVPISMVATVLLLEYLITLTGPYIERWFFVGKNQQELQLLDGLRNRLITQTDLEQLLETILDAIRDLTRAQGVYLAVLENGTVKSIVQTGRPHLHAESDPQALKQLLDAEKPLTSMIQWKEDTLLPLYGTKNPLHNHENANGNGVEIAHTDDGTFLGLLGLTGVDVNQMEEDHRAAFLLLVERIIDGMQDRRTQIQIFSALRSLSPEMDRLQEIRATARFNTSSLYANELDQAGSEDVAQWVKDALSHYWGGPKLTESPLLQLNVVQSAASNSDTQPANALRSILKDAIERVRPEGEPHLTNEWLLYNILDLKFLQGKKVREIASRLSISEADLYRKQRVAIEEVSKSILEIENEFLSQPPPPEE